MRDSEFALIPYLIADLRRYRALTAGVSPANSPAWRLGLSLFSPRFAPILLCRFAYSLYCCRLGPLARLVSLINFVFFGIEIAVRCPIGKGLFFPHTQGTVIGAARIGANATIYHGVTLGAKEIDLAYSDGRRPVIGDGVLIGSGAKVLGGVEVGNLTRIGANAVVIRSVPAGALVLAPLPQIVEDRGGQVER